LIAEIVGYTGNFYFDTSKPDGMPGKLPAGNSLQEALQRADDWFLECRESVAATE
jgi:predicted RNase H-like HicB family nuclease